MVTETKLEEATKIEDAVVEDEAIVDQLLLVVVIADHANVKTTKKRLLQLLMAVPRKVKKDPQEEIETVIEVEEEEVAETLTVAKLANKIRTVEMKPIKVRADPVVSLKITKLAMTAMAKTAMKTTSLNSKSLLAGIQIVSSEVVRVSAEL